MRCLTCGKELVTENKFGLTLYKHDDGKYCKILNNQNLKTNQVMKKIEITNKRALNAFISLTKGQSFVENKLRDCKNDKELFDTFIEYKEFIPKIFRALELKFNDESLNYMLSVYIEETNDIKYKNELNRYFNRYDEVPKNVNLKLTEKFREYCKISHDKNVPDIRSKLEEAIGGLSK